MDVSASDSDWRSAAFRQKLVSQIDEAMRKAGVAHDKSSKEMESHVFLKAKTREEYLSLVARLIIDFRDIHNKKSQSSVSDPMNVLKTLTGATPVGPQGMPVGVHPPGAQLGGIGGMPQMAQQMSLPGQPQPGVSGMAPHGVSTGNQPNYACIQEQNRITEEHLAAPTTVMEEVNPLYSDILNIQQDQQDSVADVSSIEILKCKNQTETLLKSMLDCQKPLILSVENAARNITESLNSICQELRNVSSAINFFQKPTATLQEHVPAFDNTAFPTESSKDDLPGIEFKRKRSKEIVKSDQKSSPLLKKKK